MDSQLVTVMIPVYNGLATLPLAISSLKAQTYSNWSAIIVNDGSTDGTKEYLDSLEDERFVVIHFDKNKGRPYARQAALDAAKGTYLAFLDADDFYHPEKLNKQVSLFKEYPKLGLVSCANASFGSEMEILTVRGEGNNRLSTMRLTGNPPVALRTSLIDLSIAKSIKFDVRLNHAQDSDFLNSYFKHSDKYLVQSEVLYFYSEFESVTIRKIVRTYFYNLIQLNKHLKGFLKLKMMTLEVMKIFGSIIYYLLKGQSSLIKRRGRLTSDEEKRNFKELLRLLKKE